MNDGPTLAPSFREHQEHDVLEDDNSMRVILPVTLALGSMFAVMLGLCCCHKANPLGEVNQELLN